MYTYFYLHQSEGWFKPALVRDVRKVKVKAKFIKSQSSMEPLINGAGRLEFFDSVLWITVLYFVRKTE